MDRSKCGARVQSNSGGQQTRACSSPLCHDAESTCTKMTALGSKEEISDTDSGIILQSGLESPISPLRDLSTTTRALKLKHQSLEDRLEVCLLELRKICLQEAELTGKLPSDFPLMLDEKPPQVRRRIGASFKLDEGVIHLGQQGLERDLAVQQQIHEAVRKLCQEENLSKSQRRSRLQQLMKEEKKVQELQEALLQHQSRRPARSLGSSKDLNVSDDSSLSDVAALDDDVDLGRPPSPPAMDGRHTAVRGLESEGCPVQSSPWKESSLDMPYQKSAGSSRSSSPILSRTPAETRFPLSQFIRNAALRHSHSISSPSTPELHVRRQHSHSFRLYKGRSNDSESSGLTPGTARLLLQHCTTDSSGHSLDSSPPRSSSGGSRSPPSFSSRISWERPSEVPKLCPPPYGFHCAAAKTNLPWNKPAGSGSPLKSSEEDGPRLRHNTGRCFSPWPRVIPQRRVRVEEEARLSGAPPPYSRLVRTPSLQEYPSHAAQLVAREKVTEELKTWHQRNQLLKSGAGGRPQHTAATSAPRQLLAQTSGTVVLQRSADGTPLQWFVADDGEIVSQV
ncbi:innate immunity activator protein isoform X2 [Synchiropus splendidus]|uniref:innate immunity activator protein isoform X2 n=1 Tax=Synchiropus splendidus TaxID=270530 RepID=UPI00237D63A3|nr:innate immunity activator protein isoform X2 [Synchiropus splendidus]